LLTATGDIWHVATRQDVVVIPVNLGWRGDGRAVMGAGIARQAAARFPGLAAAYGAELRGHYWARLVGRIGGTPAGRAPDLALVEPMGPIYKPVTRLCKGLVLFPVKPLNPLEPWRSWMSPASLELIQRGLPTLRAAGLQWAEDSRALTLLPLIGCGHGGLDPAVVVPMLESELLEDCFVLVKEPVADADAATP